MTPTSRASRKATDGLWSHQRGRSQTPGWYLNLARRPDQVWLQVGSRRMRFDLNWKGDARAEAWTRIVAEYSNYGGYEKKTDRVIPVVRLTPVA